MFYKVRKIKAYESIKIKKIYIMLIILLFKYVTAMFCNGQFLNLYFPLGVKINAIIITRCAILLSLFSNHMR